MTLTEDLDADIIFQDGTFGGRGRRSKAMTECMASPAPTAASLLSWTSTDRREPAGVRAGLSSVLSRRKWSRARSGWGLVQW
jgi:hypothetical protein